MGPGFLSIDCSKCGNSWVPVSVSYSSWGVERILANDIQQQIPHSFGSIDPSKLGLGLGKVSSLD